MLWTDKVLKILKKHFNFTELKDKQIKIINELLIGNDVIGLLPTSYGKTMCYILPPLLTKKTIFIISPLISLMEDQKNKLIKMGIYVSALHSNNINKKEEIEDILNGKIKIVYMSPEYLIDGEGMNLANKLIENNKLGFLAIDESHCLSSWGHDFRPSYLKLKHFRNLIPNIPILAVTATANDDVVEEIIRFLKLKSPKIVKANFDRPNLFLSCKEIPKELPKIGKKGFVLKAKPKNISSDKIIRQYIEKYPNDRIIIYVNTRDETETISHEINKWNNCSNAYHAGFDKNKRDEIQLQFTDSIKKVIVSTIAFGMGIDQIVKCVIIFGCPSSIEEYFQQIGRCGRDNLPCETILYFDKGAFMRHKRMISYQTKNKTIEKHKIDDLYKVYNYFESKICRRHYILNHFGVSKNYFAYVGFTCDMCDNCQNTLVDYTTTYYDYCINNIKMNKELQEYINKLNLNKILSDWKEYILHKKYTIKNIPEKLKIKLPLILSEDIEEDIYDKCEKLL